MILDGKLVSKDIKNNIKKEIDTYISSGYRKPKLVIVQIGEVMASNIYVRNKLKACEYVGIESKHIKLEENITENDLKLSDNWNSGLPTYYKGAWELVDGLPTVIE